MRGRKHSAEAKLKISEAMKGYKEKFKISKNLKNNTAAGKVAVSKPVAVTDILTSTTTA